MRQIYLIPDREQIEKSLELANQYHAAFEYNDFFMPSVLDDEKRKKEIMSFYRSLRNDFSRDTMHGAFLDVTIHSEDKRIQETSMLRVRQSMEIAAGLGLRGVVFHTGRIYGFRTPHYIDRWMEQNAKFFQKMLQEYPGQEIYMENMFDESPDLLAEFAERIKGVSRFGVCFDCAHAALTSVPLSEWVKQLAPYTVHMHINDNDLVNDLHLSVGAGKIDWGELDRLLLLYRTDASVLIEVKAIESQMESLAYLERKKILI